MIESGLFVGTLRHRRFTPAAHAFTYRLFMPLVDIDRIPELMRVSRLTGYNRLAWAAFHERDHFGDPSRPLRERLRADAAREGIELPDGPIFLLTNLRYLGYCFNPISLFYLFDRSGRLQRVLAEVNNTFGGSHNYWLGPESESRAFRSGAAKALYVSPFMPADMDYRFLITPPGDRLVAHIDTMRSEEVVLDATLTLERRPWSAAEIRRQLFRRPATTLHVLAGIHWQALKLWRKGVPLVKRLTTNGVGERAAWQASQAERAARE